MQPATGQGTAWTGQKIRLEIEGTGVAVNGGVRVVASPTATTVSATARMLGFAFPEDKSAAEQSIFDAKSTFTITSDASTITVRCGNGQSHASSNAGDSGCELAEITIPAGTAAQPLDLTVLIGNGDLNLDLGSAVITNVGANNNGSGDTIARLPATDGASISINNTKATDITATMPSGFSADEILLQADADKIVNNVSGALIGAGAGGVGTDGAGLVSLKLTSQPFAGSTGTITLN